MRTTEKPSVTECRALVADLPRLARIVECHARPAAGRSRGLEDAQSLFLGHAGGIDAAENAHGVALLEAVQRARCSARLDVRERRYGHELAVRRLDLEVEQRAERGPVLVADLRDHLVATIKEIEPVHVMAAEQRAELLTDAGEVEPEIGDLLAIEHDARLGQVDLQVRIDVQELAALPTGIEHRRGRLEQLLGRRVALQYELDVGLTGRGQRRVEAREYAQAGDLRKGAVHLAEHLLGRALALRPMLGDQTPETAPRRGQRPHEVGFGKRGDGALDLQRTAVGCG
jgi:hypothetical protein